MKAAILKQLDHINQEFYQNYSKSFSQTRGKLQSGVQKILEQIPNQGKWLDVGCGNGNLAHAWGKKGNKGHFYGIDFSSGLIADARRALPSLKTDQKLSFAEIDLTGDNWIGNLPKCRWDGIFCFAVLHHIPGKSRRENMCAQLRQLLFRDHFLWVSVWQPLNSPRLEKRIQPWGRVGLCSADVESGDVLMDWRAHQALEKDNPALRFVHIFTPEELSVLAATCGFSVAETFFSDGREGNLGLYQKWVAIF
jgi:tRNA (uracil-5-)-methyltransferase TRM9